MSGDVTRSTAGCADHRHGWVVTDTDDTGRDATNRRRQCRSPSKPVSIFMSFAALAITAGFAAASAPSHATYVCGYENRGYTCHYTAGR